MWDTDDEGRAAERQWMGTFGHMPAELLGPVAEQRNQWQGLEYQTNGDERLFKDTVAALRYPADEAELNPAFTFKASDILIRNA